MLVGLLERHGLNAVMAGEAAAALRGVPSRVTDVDFVLSDRRGSLPKLKRIAADLKATVWRQYYPPGDLIRISRDTDCLQLNFWRNAESIPIRKPPECSWVVPAEPLKRAWPRSSRNPNRPKVLKALKNESDWHDRDMIRRLLALPMERRTNFLRVKIGLRGSCL
jgi:hypothetical protein